jgi:IMP dehydrogenase
MPIANGDAMTNTTVDALDHTKALEILKNEYTEHDGIDVKTLIDSKKNGGLTYNDFLMLPGYIGAFASPATNIFWLSSSAIADSPSILTEPQASLPLRFLSIPQSRSASP